tara:strand:+ start:2420 stop:3040 length:621 start_codon:yes stop_codon:yes gene_type:complete
MNRVLTSFNTLFFILLFLSFIFSVFSIPTLNVGETETIRVNFYELTQKVDTSKKSLSGQSKGNNKSEISSKNIETIELENPSKIKKFKINKSDIRNEISKIKLTREKEAILKISALIQDKISAVWIKPNSLSQMLSAKVLINLAPSGEVLSFNLTEPSINKSFNESVLTAMNKIIFFEEVIEIDRKLFESNFRNFKLVFKSSGEIE